MTEEERRARLVDWFETIKRDVQDLLLDDHIFRELQEIVRANPAFKECSGLFTDWMASSFAQATAVGIRRQAKERDGVSLKRALNEIKTFPTLVSCEHYLSLFNGQPVRLAELAEEDFREIADGSGAHLRLEIVERHIEELTEAVRIIEHYVDRRIAHRDPRGLAERIPTFDDVTSALEKLESIILFYWCFLTGEAIPELLPQPQFDWEEIFSFPWIPPESEPD